MAELTLIWAILVTVILVILFVFLIRTRMKYENKFEKIKFTIEKERAEQQVIIEKEKAEVQEQHEVTIIEERKDALDSSRNTIKGKISEQMSPLFPEFYSKYEPSDARFLGSPIDFVIFKNMSKFDKKTKDEENPIEVVLLDIKTGKYAGLSPLQKSIKKAVEEKRVSFDVIEPNIEPQKESEPKEKRDPKELTENEKKRNDRYKKIMEVKFRKWSESDDEYLKTFWNNNSNSQSKFEKIEELSKKFDRSKGAIVSRLEKHGLE